MSLVVNTFKITIKNKNVNINMQIDNRFNFWKNNKFSF